MVLVVHAVGGAERQLRWWQDLTKSVSLRLVCVGDTGLLLFAGGHMGLCFITWNNVNYTFT